MNYIDFGCAMCTYPIYIYVCFFFLTSQVPCHPLLVWPCSHERSNWSTFQSSITPFKDIWGGWMIFFSHEFNLKRVPNEFNRKQKTMSKRVQARSVLTHAGEQASWFRDWLQDDIFHGFFFGLPYGLGTIFRPLRLKSSELFTMRGLLSLLLGLFFGFIWHISWVLNGYFFVGSTLDAFFTIPVISSAFFEVSFYIDHPQFNWGWFINVLVSMHEKDLMFKP